MSAAFRTLTLLLFTAQTLAFGGTSFVCRYTGQVMESCCCPTDEAGASSPQLQADCCCDVHTTEREVVSAVVGGEQAKLRAPAVPMVATTVAVWVAPVLPVGRAEVRSAGPPAESRLYLKLRTLLI